MKRSFEEFNVFSSHWEVNKEELDRLYSKTSGRGSDYNQTGLSAKTSRQMLLNYIHGLPTPSTSLPNNVRDIHSETNSSIQGVPPRRAYSSESSRSSLSSHSSHRSNRSSRSTRSTYATGSGRGSSESSATSWASISPHSSVVTPGVTPCGPSPTLDFDFDWPLFPCPDPSMGSPLISYIGDLTEHDNPQSYTEAPTYQPWSSTGGAYPVSHIYKNNQYSQTFQETQCSGVYVPDPNYTPPRFDPTIQALWHLSGLQPQGVIPSQQNIEQNQVLQSEQCILPTPTSPSFPESSLHSYQSYIPQREDPIGKQIANPQPESEKAITLPVVADSNNVMKQLITEIRPEESPDRKLLASNSSQVSVTSKSSPVTASKGRVHDWRLGVQDAASEIRSDDSRSLSASVSAEEDLEDRISYRFGDDPSFARALICNLKDKVDFILPLFGVEEDQDFYEYPFVTTPPGYERGSSQGTTSNSNGSSESKSYNSAMSATPATSSDAGKEGKAMEDEDKSSKNRQPSIKRRRLGNSRASGGQERRRLRCHFHAKCPASHNKRTCTQSGWLCIHNLKGHYDAHHTVIRCNKCFEEFAKKSEKNVHQRNCTANDASPTLEVIDCDRADEIDEMISSFRTWKLDDEQDDEMKAWIMKYKLELNNNTKDDAYDSRELAKWYKYWVILYPTHQGVVPTPFQISSASPGDQKLERWLEVFQCIVETKLGQNQLPPSEPRRQIDYYKDVIRDVYNLIQPNSSSRTVRSPQSMNTPDPRSLPTPADSSSQASPKSKGSPEDKQGATPGQETLTEDNDQDLASQNPQPSKWQPTVNYSQNKIAEAVSTEKQSSTKPPAIAKPNTAPSTSRYACTSVAEPIQGLSEPDLSRPHAALAEPPEFTITPPHNNSLDYVPGARQAGYVSQAPSLPNFNDMSPPIYQGPSMDFPYLAAITSTSVTGTQNAWTNDLASGEENFPCHFCNGFEFVDLGKNTQRCAYCYYMPPEHNVPT